MSRSRSPTQPSSEGRFFRCSAFAILLLLAPSAMIAPLQGQQPTAIAPASDSQAYTLRPGDIIRIRIWREPDLSGDFPVDEAGRVNLPLVGAYSVAGESRASLHEKLVAAYGRSVENLSMDVIFIRRIAVVGSVRNAGLIPVEPTMTVGDAIAIAGGIVGDSREAKILLMRSGRAVIENLDPAVLVSQLPIQRGDQIFIPSDTGNFFTRYPWVITSAVQILLTVVTIVAARN